MIFPVVGLSVEGVFNAFRSRAESPIEFRRVDADGEHQMRGRIYRISDFEPDEQQWALYVDFYDTFAKDVPRVDPAATVISENCVILFSEKSGRALIFFFLNSEPDYFQENRVAERLKECSGAYSYLAGEAWTPDALKIDIRDL